MKHTLFTLITIISLSLFSNSYAQEQGHHGAKDNEPALSIIEIMRGMDKSLSELSSAIMYEDFKLISSSAHNIAFHPGITKDDLNALFKRLGDKKEDFIACDKEVHELAIEVAMAGKEENMEKVLANHSAMIAKTTECHKNYR